MLIKCKKYCFIILYMAVFVGYGYAQYDPIFTREEFSIWKERALHGPYKSTGDAGTNSPNDWERIKQNAENFAKTPLKDLIYKGPDGAPVKQNGGPHQDFKKEVWIVDAAFKDKVLGETLYRDKLIDLLWQQATDPDNNGIMDEPLNTTYWQNGIIVDSGPLFGIAGWLQKMLYVYDWVGRENFTPTQRTEIEQWLKDWATFIYKEAKNPLDRLFHNTRDGKVENYRVVSAWSNNDYPVFYGSPYYVESVGRHYNNRRAMMESYLALAGCYFDNELWKKEAKIFVKEWLAYSWYADGSNAEFHRSERRLAGKGISYTLNTMEYVSMIADRFARCGDMELLTYSTQAGSDQTASPGVDKSLLWAWKEMGKHIDGTYKRYANFSEGSKDDVNRLWLHNSDRNWYGQHQLAVARINIYYKDDYLKGLYQQTLPGMPVKGYYKNPASNGPYITYEGGGAWYPGILFMFGQMEGKVWPYDNSHSGTGKAPLSPTDLTVNSESSSKTTIAWKDNSDNETAFVIEVSEGNNTNFKLLKELGSNVVSYNHTDLKENTTYFYRVKAKNHHGESGYSNVSSAKTKPNSSSPNTPSALKAKGVSDSEIEITWTDNSDNEESFIVYWASSENGDFVELATVAANVTTYKDAGLSKGESRHYVVKANNKAGTSGFSNKASAKTLSCSDLVSKPVLKANRNLVLCQGDRVTLSAPEGYEDYQWRSGKNNIQSIIVETAGSYAVRVQDENGCWSEYSDDLVVEVFAAPQTPQIKSAGNIICPGEDLTLSVSGKYAAYQWSNNESSEKISVGTPGSYRLRVQDKNGCWSDYTESYEVNYATKALKPSVTYKGSTQICEGEKITLSAPEGYDDYQWSTGEITPSIEVTQGGEYAVRVAASCSENWSEFSDPVNITVHPTPKVPVVHSRGDSLVTDSRGKHQWYLNGRPILGATSKYYVPLRKGDYAVEVKSTRGCLSIADANIISDVNVNILNAFPNPNNGVFQVEIEKPKHYEYELLVYNSINRTMDHQRLSNYNNAEKLVTEVDVSQFGKGIYIVKLRALDFTKTIKVLVR